MKIEPYYLQQNVAQVFLVSDSMRIMRIFAGVLWRRDVRREWSDRNWRFSMLWVAISRESSEIRPKLLGVQTKPHDKTPLRQNPLWFKSYVNNP